uniref:FA_desaturase domain-containing protein n=1 Tax=Heterorhabditis bacteriophora TaxID=37862 RepID=A0A1I7X2Q3_HETBA
MWYFGEQVSRSVMCALQLDTLSLSGKMTISTGNSSKKAVVDKVISEQFLAADLEELEHLQEEGKKYDYKAKIVWRNVALFVALHFGSAIGLYQIFFEAKWQTIVWSKSFHFFASFCSTAPSVEDINTNTLNLFKFRYYIPLVLIFCFLLPTAIPVKFWGESAFVAFYTAGLLRYCILLHATWLINSAAHKSVMFLNLIIRRNVLFFLNSDKFGFKPYDKAISPVESIWTTVSAIGEGGHNFHHTFPQDYRTSEYSLKLNWTRIFIDTCAALGLVYDRKSFSEEIIKNQCEKHGDPGLRAKAL